MLNVVTADCAARHLAVAVPNVMASCLLHDFTCSELGQFREREITMLYIANMHVNTVLHKIAYNVQIRLCYVLPIPCNTVVLGRSVY